MQSIQTVSRYVLENEEEFISQLKALWSEQKSKQTGTGQQELEEAGKRVQELDSMIQNLYESSMKGLLPERQVQRMIQQYDEEQILLERRIGELQEQMKQEEVKKVETERFIALVKKYRDCGEVTDTMLYAFPHDTRRFAHMIGISLQLDHLIMSRDADIAAGAMAAHLAAVLLVHLDSVILRVFPPIKAGFLQCIGCYVV